MSVKSNLWRLGASVVLLCGIGSVARADIPSTITIKVGYGAGGSYDLSSRLIARYLGKYLPGNPSIIVQNVPGGGSLKLAKMMAASEPADGSVIASVSSGMAYAREFDPDTADFDPHAVQWIGALAKDPSICVVSKASGIDTMEKFLTEKFLIGASGKSSTTYFFAAIPKNAFGAQYQIVTGFDGAADIELAIRRGELAGTCGTTNFSVQSAGLSDEVNFIGSFGRGDVPGNVPHFTAAIKDPLVKQAAELIESIRDFHLPLVVPAATPKETVDQLRAAYDKMVVDPEFLAESKKLGDVNVNPTSGAALEQMITEGLKSDPAVFEAARGLVK